jgi:hypothetical protein
MEKAFGNEFRAQQLVDFGRHEIAVRLTEDGENRVPFQAKTLPPLELRAGRKEKLITRSRERFAQPRQVVEEKLHHWISANAADSRNPSAVRRFRS